MRQPDAELDRIMWGIISVTAVVGFAGLAIWSVIYLFWKQQ